MNNALVYCADNNVEYIQKCLNSIESFRLYNNNIDIYLLTNLDFKYEKILNIYKPFIKIIKIDTAALKIDKCYTSFRWTIATYYKFAFFKIPIFQTYDSVIFCDSDTVFSKTINDLYLNSDMYQLFGFVFEDDTNFIIDTNKIKRIGKYLDTKNFNYFNAGFCFFKMKKLANTINFNDFYKKCIDLATTENFLFVDQDVLNIIIQKYYNNFLFRLPCKYNYFYITETYEKYLLGNKYKQNIIMQHYIGGKENQYNYYQYNSLKI